MKPNILVIMSDQHGARWSGAYGDSYVRTPHLDSLASRGVVFENAYTTCPICVPARMSFLTGKYVSDIEVWDNNTILPSEVRTWPMSLANAGYDVVLAGKMHFRGPDKLHGFRAQISRDPAGDSDRTAPVPDWANSRVPGYSMPEMKKYGVLPDGQGDVDNQTEEAAIDYIRERTGGDQPWCACVGFAGPHPSWRVERRYLDLYPLDTVPMPEIPSGHLERQSPVHKRNRAMHEMTGDTYADEDVRRARQAYFAKISRLDGMIGNLLAELEETGQAESTVIIYTSDHGEMAGEHGLWHKHCFYEESSHIPLIVRIPQHYRDGRPDSAVQSRLGFQSGHRVNELVSLVDVTSTVLDLALTDELPASRGISLLPALRGENHQRTSVFAEYYATWVDRATAMIRERNHKLVWSHGEEAELYDVSGDPRELQNLHGDQAVSDVEDSLESELRSLWDPADVHERVLTSQAQRLPAWLASRGLE